MNKHCEKLVKLYSFFECVNGYLVYSDFLDKMVHRGGDIFMFKVDKKPEIIITDVANKCNYYLSVKNTSGEFKSGNKELSDDFYFILMDNNINIIHDDKARMIKLHRQWIIKQIVNND